MPKRDESFTKVVRAALAATPVFKLLGHRSAVVLERIARGGGATSWYSCGAPGELGALEERLLPGSVVSFYFDDRIQQATHCRATVAKIEELISRTGECIVGVLAQNRLDIDASVLNAVEELAELLQATPSSAQLFFGVFPARDNDAVNAVTVTLPDADGIVRGHPH